MNVRSIHNHCDGIKAAASLSSGISRRIKEGQDPLDDAYWQKYMYQVLPVSFSALRLLLG